MTLPKKSRPSTRKFSLPKSNEIREKIDLSDLEQKVYTFMAQTKLYKNTSRASKDCPQPSYNRRRETA